MTRQKWCIVQLWRLLQDFWDPAVFFMAMPGYCDTIRTEKGAEDEARDKRERDT